MENLSDFVLERNYLINVLTGELPVLRARLGISQEDISKRIGISRQTYSLIEGKKQKMTWITFMSLVCFFSYNQATREMLNRLSFFDNEAFKKCIYFK